MKNFFLVILDGIGAGELPDAADYGDAGSNTLANMARVLNGISLPEFQKMGLGNITEIRGVAAVDSPLASYGKMKEVSAGKDSTTGHWEIAGIKVEYDFPYYPDGFPDRIISKFLDLTGVPGILGNKAASGTEIIKELGAEHVKTGYPIVYTSADSVFQIAAHEDIIPLKKLYEICDITRTQVMTGCDSVGRIIARPFTGEEGNYTRTVNRHDYSLDPVSDTILDVLTASGINTVAIGKINDLFNNRGIRTPHKTKSNAEGMQALLKYQREVSNSLVFANLVDFDVYYGHRNDPPGMYKALLEFDSFLPALLAGFDQDDILVITSDHGNDTTDISTDHTREYVPLLVYRKGMAGVDLGIRQTFSDVAQTIAEFFSVENRLQGRSFLDNNNQR